MLGPGAGSSKLSSSSPCSYTALSPSVFTEPWERGSRVPRCAQTWGCSKAVQRDISASVILFHSRFYFELMFDHYALRSLLLLQVFAFVCSGRLVGVRDPHTCVAGTQLQHPGT